MSDVAIRVENLGKKYSIGAAKERHDTLRDALVHLLHNPLGRNGDADTIWALRDVSFEVNRGEVVGVIGRNGAGKSTLLKILSRITEPSEGLADLYGRVGSLLEVGTGFHPELTGRENIYLSGAILGMHKAEIDRRFDEIVAFAEIDKFLDTPVKRYSSGMYVRLAFAVAAHLEPEILLVDEVLAVGDAEFQKKCLGKMGDVAREGRTVLFVSHNMSAVQRLCSRCMLISSGKLIAFEPTAEVVHCYLSEGNSATSPLSWVNLSGANREGLQEARFVAAWYSSDEETVGCQPYSLGVLRFQLSIESNRAYSVSSFAVALCNMHGELLVNADVISLGRPLNFTEGSNTVSLEIEELYLNSGTYTVSLYMADRAGYTLDYIPYAFNIGVIEKPVAESFGVKPGKDGLIPCRFDVQLVSG